MIGRVPLDAARNERFRRLFAAAGVTAADDLAQRAASTYRERYAAARRAVAGAAALLRLVRSRARVGIVSNNLLEEQREKLRVCGLDGFIDALVVSEEAGAAKPDPAIFALALDRLGCAAGEAVMVGDSWPADIAGARASGIRAIWFNPRHEPVPDGEAAVSQLDGARAARHCHEDDFRCASGLISAGRRSRGSRSTRPESSGFAAGSRPRAATTRPRSRPSRDWSETPSARSDRRASGSEFPGAISPATGLVKNANSTWLIGRPLREDLTHRLQREVRIANDANCFALSEAVDGAAAGQPIVFGVIIGTGTGGAIVANGQVLIGANAIGGEWGHNPMPWPEADEWPGPPCYCGRTGCIETFLSGPGLSRDHQAATGRRARADGDCRARRCRRRRRGGHDGALRRPPRARARLVINVVDPHAIVLGGGLSNIERLYERVPRLWGRFVFSDHVATTLLRAQHGDSSGVRGAAWLWTMREQVERGLEARPTETPERRSALRGRYDPTTVSSWWAVIRKCDAVHTGTPSRSRMACGVSWRMPKRVASSSERRRWLCTVMSLYAARAAERSTCTCSSSSASQLTPQVRLCLNSSTGRSSDSAIAASSSSIWDR